MECILFKTDDKNCRGFGKVCIFDEPQLGLPLSIEFDFGDFGDREQYIIPKLFGLGEQYDVIGMHTKTNFYCFRRV